MISPRIEGFGVMLQYLGLSLENAEFLAPLFFFSKSCAEVRSGKSVN
jgi:hypothetical protein